MNPNLKTAFYGLGAGAFLLPGILVMNPAPRPVTQQAVVQQPVVTAPAPQPVVYPEKWVVVLVSWEHQERIDHKFDSYEECHLYMVEIALPMIRGYSQVYAKCVEIG